MRRICIRAIALGALLLGAQPLELVAEEKPVVEEILEILRSSGQIDEAKYDALRQRLAEEDREREEKYKRPGDSIADPVERAVEPPVGTVEKVEAIETLGAGAAPAEKEASTDFKVYWKDSLRFETRDQKFQLKIGGRIQNDWAVIVPDEGVQDEIEGLSGTETGTEFRRARLYLGGKLYDHFEFKSQFDFAGGEVSIKDLYIALVDVPMVEWLGLGHLKQPFSLEQQTSSNWNTFMERSLVADLEEVRNTGLRAVFLSENERMNFSAGGFKDVDGDSADGFGDDGKYNVVSRLTFLPWYEDDGRRFLHLGFSYAHAFQDGSDTRFRQKPSSNLAHTYVDTETFTADDIDVIDPEIALVVGPFSLQGEYKRAFIRLPEGSSPQIGGYYVQASYFLTGENRVYDRAKASFARLRPRRNVFDGGWGAWEVAARYSSVDLNSKSLNGGKLSDVTAGVNWYLNPNLQVKLNYVFADLDDAGATNIAQMRFQLAM